MGKIKVPNVYDAVITLFSINNLTNKGGRRNVS